MDISIIAIKSSFLHFLKRFHATIFTLTVLVGLVFVVLALNNIVSSSSTSANYTPAGTPLTFDQQTIDRVNSLKSRDDASSELDLSQGRANPFVEN
ncbi:MAG: hypothetical protein JWO55_108 [Candidatus Saccharibacteria bacterium]|jgi:hypothetical protein|nr:hypothetical protein [Candidatus Saccharibacteria bacterium]